MNNLRLSLRTLLVFLSVLSLFSVSQTAQALPEFVRYGYFGCASCHASPTGGVMLLDYGRTIISEKIATWAKEGEEATLWGATNSKPEWMLLGGHARWAQVHVETPMATDGRFFTMQKELELGVHTGPLWIIGTGRSGGSLRDPDDTNAKAGQFFIRYDLSDEWMLRVGRFLPRLGLMIPQHAAAIKREMNSVPGEEADTLEATYSSEFTESSLFAFKPRDLKDENQTSGTGFGGNFSYFLLGKHRLGASSHLISQKMDDVEITTQKLSLSGAFTLNETAFVLAESAQKLTRTSTAESPTVKKEIHYLKSGIEIFKGLIPYALLELSSEGENKPDSKQSTYAFGMDWHPRPHIHLEGQYGHTLLRESFSYVNVGYLVMHLYL